MSYIDEGYIKFTCDWQKDNITVKCSNPLLSTRDTMHEMGYIGFDKQHQVGYGNISERADNNQFIISGTQTGHIYPIQSSDFTLITKFNIDANEVYCSGPVKSSSETMTHAALYEALPLVNCIIHIHSKPIWEKLLNTKMVTSGEVPYGTPEMAYEIKRLMRVQAVLDSKILGMAGHEDGVIAFGKTFEEAVEAILGIRDKL